MEKRFQLFLFITLFLVGGCSSANIGKVDVYEMESFSVLKQDSLISYTDSDAVDDFVKGFAKAKSEPGAADMVDPEYQVEFGEESYYLWISETHGTIMNLKDSHTIYTLSKKSAETIYGVLK